tara:strand:- start:105050 stop:105580 length:531 start_codon:yes stop_codon:yes gene_type:complete
MNKLIIALLINSSTVLAAGSGHASVLDLKWPAVNLIMLASLLVWMAKKPVKEMFDKNAEDVKSLYELAEKKDKEAEIRLKMYQEKMDNLHREKEKVVKQSNEEFTNFSGKTKKETDLYIQRITEDVGNKIDNEEKSLVRELEQSLVNEVVSKAKAKIAGDESSKLKATKKLISQIK